MQRIPLLGFRSEGVSIPSFFLPVAIHRSTYRRRLAVCSFEHSEGSILSVFRNSLSSTSNPGNQPLSNHRKEVPFRAASTSSASSLTAGIPNRQLGRTSFSHAALSIADLSKRIIASLSLYK